MGCTVNQLLADPVADCFRIIFLRFQSRNGLGLQLGKFLFFKGRIHQDICHQRQQLIVVLFEGRSIDSGRGSAQASAYKVDGFIQFILCQVDGAGS